MSLPVCPPVRLAIWLRRWAIVGVLCGGKWSLRILREEICSRRVSEWQRAPVLKARYDQIIAVGDEDTLITLFGS